MSRFLTPLSKVVTELQTAGYAMVRRLSTCIRHCSAHTGSNMGCEENGFELKEKEEEGGGGGCEEDGESGGNEKTFLLLTLLH